MPRPPRIFYAGAMHHLMARGNNQMDLFRKTHDLRIYRKLWVLAKKRFQLKVYRWCWMTNHIHLLIQQMQDVGISESMHYVQGRYARYFARQYRWKGHVWESRYKDRLILDNDYFRTCAAYIEDNPVKAGMVATPADYRWSSAAYYAKGFKDPLTDPEPLSGWDFFPPSDPDTLDGDSELFIGRRAVGRIDKLKELSKKLGKDLLVTSRRSAFRITP